MYNRLKLIENSVIKSLPISLSLNLSSSFFFLIIITDLGHEENISYKESWNAFEELHRI